MPGQTAENIKLMHAFSPRDSAAATITGDAIDRLGYNSARVTLRVGAASGTPDSYTAAWTVAHSATSGGSYVTAYTGTTLTADDTSASKVCDLTGLNRYLKVIAVITFVNGTSPKIEAAGLVALCDPGVKPAA